MSNSMKLDDYIAFRQSQTREPWIWHSFLEILSVEGTEPFVNELALPIPPGDYTKVMRFARACLEVYMCPSRIIRSGPFDAPEFPKYWPLYRESEGVLSQNQLNDYAEKYKGAKDVLFSMYEELQGWIGPQRADELKGWFRQHFTPAFDGYTLWYHAFLHLLKIISENRDPSITAQTTAAQMQAMRAFCDSYKAKRSNLTKRFDGIKESAVTGGPTLWEAVLQTFPVDSVAGFDYPWLDSVKSCLNLYLFRDEWRKIKADIGSDGLTRIAELVQTDGEWELPDEATWIG